jgi:undecaprenyl-diphosphatase
VNSSFPSDHAIGAFVIATSIWLFRKREGTLWLVLAACISFSRIFTDVHVHYPSDVLAGALIGIASAAGVHAVLVRWSVSLQAIDEAIRIYENLELKIWPKSPSFAIIALRNIYKINKKKFWHWFGLSVKVELMQVHSP